MPCTPHRLAPLPRPSLQHGQGLGDKFSVDYIFMDAQKAVNGTPATGVDEVAWLRAFLWARKALLASWDAVSAVSTPRIDIYQKLVDLGERLGEFQCTDGRQGMRGMPVLRSGQQAQPCLCLWCSAPALTHLAFPRPAMPAVGNLNLDGPLYFDLKKRNTTDANGKPVWQVLNVYYVSLGGCGGSPGQAYAVGVQITHCLAPSPPHSLCRVSSSSSKLLLLAPSEP